MAKKIDVRVHKHGTLFRFELLTKRAEEWVRENCPDVESWQWCQGLIVENRYAQDLAQGMLNNQLRVI